MEEERTLIRLTFQALGFRYSGASQWAFQGVTDNIVFSKCLAFLGPSGCGKSTMLKLLCGALGRRNPSIGKSVGKAYVDGIELDTWLAEIGLVSIVWQAYDLFPNLSLRRNIELPGLVRGAQNARVVADDLMERFDIGSVSDRHPGEVSSGQRARASLARALILKPKVLFLDEPFANLDVITKLKICNQLCGSMGDSRIILATHNILDVLLLADHAMFMERNETSDNTMLQEVLRRSSVAAVYEDGDVFGQATEMLGSLLTEMPKLKDKLQEVREASAGVRCAR